MTKERWILIPKWDSSDGFQHYVDRDPIWIKNYRTLLAKDEYLRLSFHLRGILHSLWLEYAASNRQIRDNTLTLTRRLGQRVTTQDLERLNHAGFIRFSASKPLARRKPRVEKEKEQTRAGEQEPKTGGQKPSGAAFAIRTLIANGAILDQSHLEAELGGHPELTTAETAHLRILFANAA